MTETHQLQNGPFRVFERTAAAMDYSIAMFAHAPHIAIRLQCEAPDSALVETASTERWPTTGGNS